MTARPRRARRGARALICLGLSLAAAGCARRQSVVVPLAPELSQAEPSPGTNLRGNRPLAHDREEPRLFWRRGRNDERPRIPDLQAAHARLAVLDAQIEEEKAHAE